jgi:hypothetical protein
LSAAAYVMWILLCEFLWLMHYSFPQNTMDTLRGRPEYQKMLEYLRQAGVYADRVIEQLRTQFRQHSAYKHEQGNYNWMRFMCEI